MGKDLHHSESDYHGQENITRTTVYGIPNPWPFHYAPLLSDCGLFSLLLLLFGTLFHLQYLSAHLLPHFSTTWTVFFLSFFEANKFSFGLPQVILRNFFPFLSELYFRISVCFCLSAFHSLFLPLSPSSILFMLDSSRKT